MQNSRHLPDGWRYKQKEAKIPQWQFVQNGGKKRKKIRHKSVKKSGLNQISDKQAAFAIKKDELIVFGINF